MFLSRGLGTLAAVLVSSGVLLGCAQVNKAPVEDRSESRARSTVDPSTLPGAENAGKPGYYTVQPGDTLIRIGLEHGQSWKDIARWSNLSNPDLIEVGQVVRVVPPGSVESQASGARPVTSTSVQAVTLPPAGSSSSSAAAAKPAATAPATTTSSSTSTSSGGDASGLGFIWPASGPVIAGFNEATNKGVDIAGKAGDPVLAAADGRVVYAGSGLRGYGHLVILKHNNTYLTAYAHNQKLLVKEDQSVKKGQKIAEMGSSDADRVKLHFEVRRQGKPVDPSRYLPAR